MAGPFFPPKRKEEKKRYKAVDFLLRAFQEENDKQGGTVNEGRRCAPSCGELPFFCFSVAFMQPNRGLCFDRYLARWNDDPTGW